MKSDSYANGNILKFSQTWEKNTKIAILGLIQEFSLKFWEASYSILYHNPF